MERRKGCRKLFRLQVADDEFRGSNVSAQDLPRTLRPCERPSELWAGGSRGCAPRQFGSLSVAHGQAATSVRRPLQPEPGHGLRAQWYRPRDAMEASAGAGILVDPLRRKSLAHLHRAEEWELRVEHSRVKRVGALMMLSGMLHTFRDRSHPERQWQYVCKYSKDKTRFDFCRAACLAFGAEHWFFHRRLELRGQPPSLDAVCPCSWVVLRVDPCRRARSREGVVNGP